MDLLVIVLCLLSERFLVHKSSHDRFHWFMAYGNGVLTRFPASISSWLKLALIVLPFLLLTGVVLHFVDHLLYGVVGLLLNIVIFYYCLGPVNPFYPVHTKLMDEMVDDDIGHYLVRANGELFSAVFWYLVLGPVGMLAYRLVSLSQGLTAVTPQAVDVLNFLEWLPARMTALLYLMVGNFQVGYEHFSRLFFSPPAKNNHMLSLCGLAALSFDSREQKAMIQAENLVEHAAIAFLALLAFCTIFAWM